MMKMNERVNELLNYLDRLTKLKEGGYNCHKEIAECVFCIRKELEIVPFESKPKSTAEKMAIAISMSDKTNKRSLNESIAQLTKNFNNLTNNPI